MAAGPWPLRGEALRLLDALEGALVRPFVPNGSVAAFDMGVAPGFSRLDVPDRDPPGLSPFRQLAADAFGAVVDAHRLGASAPFDDPVQASNDPFGRRRKVRVDARSLWGEVIGRVRRPEPAAIARSVGHEVHRPNHVRASGTVSASGLSRFGRLRGLMRRVDSGSRPMDAPAHGSTGGPSHRADGGSEGRIPGSSSPPSARPEDRRSARSRRPAWGCSESRSR